MMEKLLEERKLVELLAEAEKLLSLEKQVVDVQASSVLFVGDTHGDLASTLSALKHEAEVKVFLGDYVDRGLYQLENIVTLLEVKLEKPDSIVLLRGNHESPFMNEVYGFKRTVLSRYNREIYQLFVKIFSNMSYAALVNGEIFSVHGGVARGLETLNQIEELPKGDEEPLNPLAFQILWNDPDEEVEEFEPSPRGPGAFLFGLRPLQRLMDDNGLQLVIRAHEPFPEGYRWFFGGKLLSIFSCGFYPISSPKALLVKGKEMKIIELRGG
ncbi:MAG: metallophosphoesterase [Thermofilum sp.]